MASEKTNRRFRLLTRAVASLLVLALGFFGMAVMAKMKRPPATMAPSERPLRVQALRAEFEDVPVHITGYGEVQALNVVSLAPEISGRITFVHPRLEVGEVIPGGEVLFEIDSRDYESALKGAEAAVAQWQQTVLRLQTQYELDRQRIQTLARNRDLAKAQYQRVARLYKTEKVGTLAGVEQSEQTYNAARDQLDQLARGLKLNPIQIKEAQSNLAAARAQQKSARIRLQRCRVAAPFNGRVKSVAIEKDQYVTPGFHAVTLADDHVLEIHVPLDSTDAARWLRFHGGRARTDTAWFNGLEKAVCSVRWTESQAHTAYSGHLQRIVNFDPRTRTLTVAVRVETQPSKPGKAQNMPLVEGMFCEVQIPGRTLNQVVRLPRWAVSFENTVFLARENRLRTVSVEVARQEGEETLVSSGIHPGDTVITTRLVDPLENTLLDIDLVPPQGER